MNGPRGRHATSRVEAASGSGTGLALTTNMAANRAQIIAKIARPATLSTVLVRHP